MRDNMFCSNCGEKLEPGAKFCPFCGVIVENEGREKTNKQKLSSGILKKGIVGLQNVISKAANIKTKIAISLGALIGIVILVVVGVQIVKVITKGDPILIVEDNQLVCIDKLDGDSVVIDSNFADATSEELALESAALANYIQYSDDGKYGFYLSDFDGDMNTYTLTQIDLEKAMKNGQRMATQRIASHVNPDMIMLVNDTLVYEVSDRSSNSNGDSIYSETLWYYSIENAKSIQLAKDFNWIQFAGCVVSEDGNTIIYRDGDAIYLYYTPTGQKKSIAVEATVLNCSADLSKIVYSVSGENVYQATIDNGEIINTEQVFSLSTDAKVEDGYVYYADLSTVFFSNYDEDDYYGGIYRDEQATCYERTDIYPLQWTAGIRSNSKQILTDIGNSGVIGVQAKYAEDSDKATWSLLDDNLNNYTSSSNNNDYVVSYIWDNDHEIIYIVYCHWEDTVEKYRLYAYQTEQGSIIDEKLISANCSDRVFYDSDLQALFYYDDYDISAGSGTLCAITEGTEQISLVPNAYAREYYWNGIVSYGVQFDENTNTVLCWADVDAGVGTLYAIDLSSKQPVTYLGDHVSMSSWCVYEGDILFIGNFEENIGGTLFRFDGKNVSREREDIMGIASDSGRYYYIGFIT